nr:hypothetical protein [Tanacetum cinerariifolium]
KSSNLSVSQVDDASKNDLEDLFQDFYDEYFDSSKIMKSSTTNVETPINEEVFHETFYQPYPHENKWTKDHPLHKIIGDPKSSVRTRGQLANSCLFSCLLSSIEPANMAEALRDVEWVSAMQEELDQFARLKIWRLVPRPDGKSVIKTKWIFKNKKDERSLVIRNKARLVADFTVYQMDVKTAFLNGILKDEVYVGQPLGEYEIFIKKMYHNLNQLQWQVERDNFYGHDSKKCLDVLRTQFKEFFNSKEYLDELAKNINERVLKHRELRMKESEVQAIKEIEKSMKEREIQHSVTEGATLEANLVTEDIALDASLVGNENKSSDNESNNSSNDAYADIGI